MNKKFMTPFLFGGATGAIVIMIFSFSMGWIVTSGSARATASEIAAEAVKNQLVPICVHQFKAQSDSVSQLDALRELGQWEREGYVTERGWATMPGSDTAANGVARECALQLTASRP